MNTRKIEILTEIEIDEKPKRKTSKDVILSEEEIENERILKNKIILKNDKLRLEEMINEMLNIKSEYDSIYLNNVLKFVKFIFKPKVDLRKILRNVTEETKSTIIVNGCNTDLLDMLPNELKHLWFYDKRKDKTYLFIGRNEVSSNLFTKIWKIYKRNEARLKRQNKKLNGVD